MNEEMIARFQANLEANIAKFGWAVQSVFPTVESPGLPFAYSIGLHAKQVPELVVIGLPGEVAHQLVNELAAYLLQRQAAGLPLDGQAQLSSWPRPFHLLQATAALAEEYATGARRRSEGAASYLQIVWPNKEGLWPWSPGASESFRLTQPLLGAMSLH